MIIDRQGKFPILDEFERTDCSSSIRKANRCNSMVHMMSAILEDTIVIFFCEDTTFKDLQNN